ncbi:DUF1422 family protein [Escherichia coli]
MNKRKPQLFRKCEGRVMKQANQDRGTLLLALVAGLSINGTFAALFQLHCAIFCIPDYFPGADGLLPASTLS